MLVLNFLKYGKYQHNLNIQTFA